MSAMWCHICASGVCSINAKEICFSLCVCLFNSVHTRV